MIITKKKWAKIPLVVDFRAAQDQKHNGVTKSITHWTKELIRTKRNDQTIYVWTNSNKIIPELPFQSSKIHHIHTNHSNLKLQLLWFLNLGKPLEEILKLPEKFILFSPDIRPLKIGKKCVKHIQYFHDIAFVKFKKTLTLKTRLWFFLSKPQKLYSSANQILTNSEFTKSELIKQYGPINIEVIHPSLPKTLPTKKIDNPSKFHLIISTLQKRKNLETIIQEFINNDEKLLIIGSSEKMFQKLKIDFNKNIKIHQNISDEEKHYLIKKSTATIYPSKYEGFGIPILESIRLKKPCLTYKIAPYKYLFKKQLTPVNYLFQTQSYIKPTKSNLYPLKKEVRKLRRLIYKLD